jgi:hypothetical protein
MRHPEFIPNQTVVLNRPWAFASIGRALILIGFCVLTQFAHAVAAGKGSQAATKDGINTAWKAAAARLRAMRVEYVTERTFKVVKDPTRYSGKLKDRPPDDILPAREYLTRISLEGPRVRREVLAKGPGPNGSLKRMRLEVTDGTRIKSLTMPGELSSFPNPVGQIHRANMPLMLYLMDNQPILFVMSRSDPAMQSFHPKFDEFRVTKTAERLDGVECVYLEAGDPKARKKVWVEKGITYSDGIDPIYSQLWLAPSRDYSVVRYAQFNDGRLRERVDLHYRKDEQANWVPESWTIELPKRGDETETEFRKSRVVKWESNPRFDRSEWDFKFPPDAQVSDRD